nr:immunoglobulin heavy chain junction region [Macaca mulatta]
CTTVAYGGSSLHW